MKKFLLIFCFLFLILFTYSFKPIFQDVFNESNLIFSDAKYCVYCLNISEDLQHNNLNNFKIINNGGSYVIKTNINNAKFVKQNSSFLMGESVEFKSTEIGFQKLIKFFDITIVKSENFSGIKTIVGFSNNSNLIHSTTVDEKCVNIQIAFSNGIITIGSPLILGDY